MKFITKFNLGDRAWFMKNNKPLEVIISSISIFEVGTNQSCIKYTARNITHSVSWLDHEHLHEPSLFHSKQGLMESLFGNSTSCKGENCTALNGVGHSPECISEHEICTNNKD